MNASFAPQDRLLFVATDAAFALPTAVTLRSALGQSGGDRVRCLVLHDGVDVRIRDRVNASMPLGSQAITWLDLSDFEVPVRPRTHVPRAANFRLMIDLLDVEWPERVLYVDTDTVVRGPLEPLWELNLQGKACGAVRSVNFPSACSYGAINRYEDLALDPRAPFFNSGVLLIDTSAWFDRQVGERSRAFLKSEWASSPNGDQEALNVTLSGDWLQLAPTWNQHRPVLERNRGAELLFTDDQLRGAREEPRIIHFSDRPKPWHVECEHPWRDEWRSIAADTEFAPVELDRTTFSRETLRRLKRAAHALLRGS